MAWIIPISLVICLLLVLNLVQLLSRRSARRLADVLYIVSRRVRDKAVEVREERQDPEILEVYLLDIEGFVLGLQQSLGRRNIDLTPYSPPIVRRPATMKVPPPQPVTTGV